MKPLLARQLLIFSISFVCMFILSVDVGVEVMYEMYNPTVHSIQVLRLEKRLDDQLYYLRNAPLEHSTFSFDMQPVTLPRDVPVPVNTTKVCEAQQLQ